MFSTLRAMGDTIAVCDKLLRYPLPLAWSRHTSRCGGVGVFPGGLKERRWVLGVKEKGSEVVQLLCKLGKGTKLGDDCDT